MAKTFPPGSKESALFRKMLRNYESKQYKTGLKCARSILTSHPNHGETIALKALILNAMDKHSEAYELAREALRYDVQSGLCWHVLGILYRHVNNFDQCLRCFIQASKIEPNNQTILRDLAQVQIQLRDYEGFRNTRCKFLELRGGLRASWLAYAVSQHLTGDIPGAIETVDEYLALQRQDESPSQPAYEQSEIYLYIIQLYVESEKLEAALDFLNKYESSIVDRRAVKETYALLYFLLGKSSHAEKAYRELIDRNPDNNMYYENLERVLGFSSRSETEANGQFSELYDRLSQLYPHASPPMLRPLISLPAESLSQRMDAFLSKSILKGIPSLFASVERMYSNENKVALIENLITSYITCLRKYGTLHEGDAVKAPPTVLIWCLHFAAQHYNHLGQYDRALELSQEAIDHTPTVVELYMVKADILKNLGKLDDAASTSDFARQLDTADRFINSHAAKYLIRSGRIEQGREVASIFAREGRNTDPFVQLREMQCRWFELECAKSYLMKGDVGNALVHLHATKNFYDQIIKDQFDFHMYCMRKATLRSYIDLLKYEDNAYKHHHYISAAQLACRMYSDLHDHPFGTAQQREEQEKLASMSESERKKYLSKQRKAARKACSTATTQQQKDDKQQQQQSDGKKPNRQEWNPQELVNSKEPLEQAMSFLQPLLEFLHDGDVEPLLEDAFDVLLRRKRPLLLMKILKIMQTRKVPRHVFLLCLLKFLSYYQSEAASMNTVIKELIDEDLIDLTENTSKEDFLKQLGDLAKGSLVAHLYLSMAQHYGKEKSTIKLFETIRAFIESCSSVSLQEAQSVWLRMRNAQDVSDQEKRILSEQLATLFPNASLFKM